MLAQLLPFALHRVYLRWHSGRERQARLFPGPEPLLPRVTNEMHVVCRLLDAACGQDYPRD